MAGDEQAYARVEQIQRDLQQLDRQSGVLEQRLMELHQARATLEGLQQADGEALDTLVPIGGGIHVRASLDPRAHVMAPLGGDYATETTVEKALERLAAEVETTTGVLQRVNERADELAQAANAMVQQLGQAQA